MASSTSTVDMGQVHKGTQVIGPKGERIGKVHSQSSPLRFEAQMCLLVRKDSVIYGPRYLYIPLAAIAGVSAGKVTLNASPADIPNQGWERPPRSA